MLPLCVTEWADREMGEDGTELEEKANSWVKVIKKNLKHQLLTKLPTCFQWEQDNSMKMLFHLVLKLQRSKFDSAVENSSCLGWL